MNGDDGGCEIAKFTYFFRNNNIISVPNNAQKNVISKSWDSFIY